MGATSADAVVALFCIFNLHDKAYDTRTLSGWLGTRQKRFVYVSGWLFWILVLVVSVWIVVWLVAGI